MNKEIAETEKYIIKQDGEVGLTVEEGKVVGESRGVYSIISKETEKCILLNPDFGVITDFLIRTNQWGGSLKCAECGVGFIPTHIEQLNGSTCCPVCKITVSIPPEWI